MAEHCPVAHDGLSLIQPTHRSVLLPDENDQAAGAVILEAAPPGEVLLASRIGRTASSATIKLSVETIASSSPMVTRFMH